MDYHVYSFEKLEVYQSALSLSLTIRDLIKNFPIEERYNLTNQIKRSTDSISANIAEGWEELLTWTKPIFQILLFRLH